MDKAKKTENKFHHKEHREHEAFDLRALCVFVVNIPASLS
jgi:hypothetical protein